MKKIDLFDFRMFLIHSDYVIIDGRGFRHMPNSNVFFLDADNEYRLVLDEIVKLVENALRVKVLSKNYNDAVKKEGIYCVHQN